MDYSDIFDTENDTDISNGTTYVRLPATSTEIILDCFKLLLCLIGSSVCILIIYIIHKYKDMKKPVNIYIMHWLICDSLFILVDPATYGLFTILSLSFNRGIICMLVMSMFNIRMIGLLFIIVIMFHSFFDGTRVKLFENHCYKIVIAVWVFGTIVLTIGGMSCVSHSMYEQILDKIIIGVVLLFIISAIIMHCTRRCANPFGSTGSVPAALITGFILCWVAIGIVELMGNIADYHTFRVLMYIGQVISYLYPLLLFYLFYKVDTKFATCTRILFQTNKAKGDTNCFEQLDEDREGFLDSTIP